MNTPEFATSLIYTWSSRPNARRAEGEAMTLLRRWFVIIVGGERKGGSSYKFGLVLGLSFILLLRTWRSLGVAVDLAAGAPPRPLAAGGRRERREEEDG